MAKKNDWSISFKSTELPTALDTIAPAITNKTIWGNHLLLRIDQGGSEYDLSVTLIANNGLQEIRRVITPTEFDKSEIADREIEMCLPYDPFVRALDGATSANVVVGPKMVHLTVPGPNGPASQATLNVIPSGPVYSDHAIDGGGIVIEKAGALYKAIGLAKVACSGLPSDTIRNAVRLTIDNDNDHIVLEAADSYHAARVYGPEVRVDGGPSMHPPDIDINIPAQYVGSMKNMAGELYLAADANRVHVQCGKTCWTSVLVDGKFPNIDQLVSSEPTALFRIKTATLRNRVKQASAFGNVTIATANVKYSRVTLTLDPDDLTLGISADTSVYGSFSATESVIEAHANDEVTTINMDAAVLLKALSGIDGDEVGVAVIQEGRMISLSTEKESHFLATVLN